jgi:hypothetical protein
MSVVGPRLPTWASQQVVSYRGYTGRKANVIARAALDPEPTFGLCACGRKRLA